VRTRSPVKLVDELLIEEIRLLRFGHTRDAVTEG
jgi:hypothetical protein